MCCDSRDKRFKTVLLGKTGETFQKFSKFLLFFVFQLFSTKSWAKIGLLFAQVQFPPSFLFPLFPLFRLFPSLAPIPLFCVSCPRGQTWWKWKPLQWRIYWFLFSDPADQVAGAINRTSLFSLKKKILETQRFNNLPILKKTAQNSICMGTATSYGYNIAKKKIGGHL